jgi:dephospho-CoA kinase
VKTPHKKIIVINGSGSAGKDTFVDFCDNVVDCWNVSSVDMIKLAASELGWSGSKDEKSRKFLSDLKLLSTEYSDHSYEYIKQTIFEFMYSKDQLLFIHIREPEEIKRVKDNYKAITVLVTNKNKNIIESNMADANVENFQYDYYIDNSGSLEDLKKIAESFVREILK